MRHLPDIYEWVLILIICACALFILLLPGCGYVTTQVESQIIKDGYICTVVDGKEKCWNLVEEKLK